MILDELAAYASIQGGGGEEKEQQRTKWNEKPAAFQKEISV